MDKFVFALEKIMDFDSEQKVYNVFEVNVTDFPFLESQGYKSVKERGLDEQEKYYFVFQDKFESPRHMICVREIVDYLKEFTDEIKTYRTTMPDIVFCWNGVIFAIEVETGKNIRDKNKIKNKVSLLKKRFGNNWMFFVTNRNLENAYSKYGETATKRNIKFKIRQIFKNPRWQKLSRNLPLENQARRIFYRG